jgi:hypothetical protein
MCRTCLYTAHVYRDDVTLYLGSYYIYDYTLHTVKKKEVDSLGLEDVHVHQKFNFH